MRSILALPVFIAGMLVMTDLAAQGHGGAHHPEQRDHAEHGAAHDCPMHRSHADSAFAALQERGKIGMGVDQYASSHLFDSLPDGGRIEYLLNSDDPEGITRIRTHLRQIVEAFSNGDFSTPAFVHAQEVPGTAVMAARKGRIRYTFRELPRGGEIRVTTRDPDALRAIHSFMAFQREDHRAGGHTH